MSSLAYREDGSSEAGLVMPVRRQTARDSAAEDAAFGAAGFLIDANAVRPLACGFYTVEHDAWGRPYRWTGPGRRFEFRLLLDRRRSWEFRMKLRAPGSADSKGLAAFIDSGEVVLSGSLERGFNFVTGIIPPSDTNAARLAFEHQCTFVPQEIDPGSHDRRRIGLQFFELQLTPLVFPLQG